MENVDRGRGADAWGTLAWLLCRACGGVACGFWTGDWRVYLINSSVLLLLGWAASWVGLAYGLWQVAVLRVSRIYPMKNIG